jgi:hypothetical protein
MIKTWGKILEWALQNLTTALHTERKCLIAVIEGLATEKLRLCVFARKYRNNSFHRNKQHEYSLTFYTKFMDCFNLK